LSVSSCPCWGAEGSVGLSPGCELGS
jgi:hypothetical protein